MSIFDFFRKRKVVKQVEETNSKNPYENIRVLLKSLTKEDLQRYTIRKSLNHSLYTYSDNIEMLIQWVNWLFTVVETKGVADDRWKSNKATYQHRKMDEYMSSEGRDINPVVFINLCERKLNEICDHMLAPIGMGSNDEARIRYYRRVFNPIANDVQAVLRELVLIVNK